MDACLIISGLVSAVTSLVWPGDGIDKKRFVEGWVQFSAGVDGARNVSVPLLRHSLREDGRGAEANKLEGWRMNMFGVDDCALVLTGKEVDADEAVVSAVCPSIEHTLLRRYAYPTIFYEHVRCKLVHEGALDGSATAHPMTTQEADVSYENRLVRLPGDMERRIHFHVAWLIDLTRTIARNADAALAAGPVQRPAKWWLKG